MLLLGSSGEGCSGETTHSVCFIIRQLNPIPLSLKTNGYSQGLPGAFQTQLNGFWSERQRHRRPSVFSWSFSPSLLWKGINIIHVNNQLVAQLISAVGTWVLWPRDCLCGLRTPRRRWVPPTQVSPEICLPAGWPVWWGETYTKSDNTQNKVRKWWTSKEKVKTDGD